MVKGVFGSDIHPHTGAGVKVGYNVSGVPVSANLLAPGPFDGDTSIDDIENQLDMVDSPMAWGFQLNQQLANSVLSRLFRFRGYENMMPEPDVDYTSPDINNMFVAYRGWAIRDNREDFDGDGTFDLAEVDTNGNGILDPIEDVNGNGILDPAEVDRNGNGIADVVSPAFEMVPVTIPSFFRPQYMKTLTGPSRFW
jgi:hypothetical protein